MRRQWLAFVVCLAAAGCGGSGNKPGPPPPRSEKGPPLGSKCPPQSKCSETKGPPPAPASAPARPALAAGAVVDAAGRAPGSPLTVRAIRKQFRLDNFDGVPEPDVEAAVGRPGPGSFELRGLAAGVYDIVAETADHHVGVLPELRLAAGEQRRDLRVILGKKPQPHVVSPYEAWSEPILREIQRRRAAGRPASTPAR
jgi:hypothetical protein